MDDTREAIDDDDSAEKRKKLLEDKERLKSIIKSHAKRIETLKAEINLFKRKGGHIYTKVTSR